jgi:formate-dependent phosphoribosylglycinamide formyltransferase (GAR transformylase)
MHVLFLSPEFPHNQLRFVRALAEVGARVTGIGERPVSALSDELKSDLHGYERVDNVGDEGCVHDAVRRVQAREWVDRLEATVESHVLTVARVREATGIPGLSTASAYLCRDKLAMKQFLREGNVACAAARAVSTPDEALELAREVGYPLVLKPRDGAGASGTLLAKDEAAVRGYFAGLGARAAIIAEEYVDGHEGFYDTLAVHGVVRHEFISHYYPNVLEGMRQRWISPQIVVTNRMHLPAYDEVKTLGRKVVALLRIGTAPTHMEWFFGSKGLRFSEIGARPPGVGQWDLYSAANDLDMYKEWADAIVHGQTWGTASRSHAAGIIALRPDRDGIIDRYEGVDELHRRFGQWVLKAHLPAPGTPTQPIEAGYMANAWVQMRHPDYDELRSMLDTVGQTLRVRAR